MSGNARIRSYIDRVLRLKAGQDELAADMREVYAEAKAEGFDKTALGNVVSYIRKRDKKGADTVAEADAIFFMYLNAYDGASHAHAPAREEVETSSSAAGAEESPPGQQASAPNTAQQGGGHVTAGDPEGAGKSPETTAVKRDPVEAMDSADEAGSRPDTEHDPRTPEQIEAARIIGPIPERLRRTG